MIKKLLFLFITFFVFIWAKDADAGFGISPPYVKSDRLIPGTHYEQTINLLRSEADQELVANITINAPEIEDWITIEPGSSFDLPKDKLQVPMLVKVDAPADAVIGNYRGHINIRIAPKDVGSAGVAVALGARVDIDLTLTKESFPDFNVRLVRIPDMEELKAPWKWRIFAWFFYRVRLAMKIENTGNIPTAPSKVQMEIWDIGKKQILETSFDRRFKEINPYGIEDIEADFPTRLLRGQYLSKIKIYKENEIVYTNEITFTIYPAGESPEGPRPLGPWPWVMLGGLVGLALAIGGMLVKLKFWRWLVWVLYILLWPFLFILRRLIKLYRIIKVRFWRWLHRKTLEKQSEFMNRRADPPGPGKNADKKDN